MPGTFFNKRNVDLNQGYIPKIKFRLFGRWEEAIRMMNSLGPAIKKASVASQLKICQLIAQKVKNHLKYQDLDWEPLSDSYIQRKERSGLDGRILMSYQTYYNNIEAWSRTNEGFAFVGVRKGMYTKELSGARSRIDIATIAAVHEFAAGGGKIPRRPLWNPTIGEIGGAKGIKQLYIDHLAKVLRVNGIPVKVFFNLFK